MPPSVEELHKDQNYHLLEEMDFSSTVPFLMRYLWKVNLSMGFFFFFTLFLFALVLFLKTYYILYFDLPWNTVLKFSTFGFVVGALPVIPVHELLHGIAAKIIGARRIRYGVEWNYMMFYAAADRFVMNKKQFAFVALLPFILISAFFLTMAYLSTELNSLFWLSACFFHATMCIGDFGLLSFFEENSKKILYTYDDVSEKKTYFFEKIQI
jgi:hypothetical protein